MSGRTQFIAFCSPARSPGSAAISGSSRYAVAYVDIAGGFELDVIAACVIGGVSIAGGVGSVAGAVLGALFLGVIKNALPVIDISPFWQMAISGAVIIVAVVFNARARARARAASSSKRRRPAHDRHPDPRPRIIPDRLTSRAHAAR